MAPILRLSARSTSAHHQHTAQEAQKQTRPGQGVFRCVERDAWQLPATRAIGVTCGDTIHRSGRGIVMSVPASRARKRLLCRFNLAAGGILASS